MTAKTIFRLFTVAPREAQAAIENSKLSSLEVNQSLPAAAEDAEAAGIALDNFTLQSPASSPRSTCRDCGLALDPFGDCPAMNPRGREMERAPRFCERTAVIFFAHPVNLEETPARRTGSRF